MAGCGCDGVMCGACESPGIHLRVVDAQTQAPIEGATVKAGATTCTVESAGAYLCDVDPGAYDITITAPGYQTLTSPGTLLEPEDSGCCSCGPQANMELSIVKA